MVAHAQHGRGALNQTLPFNFDHTILLGGLGGSNEFGRNGAHRLWLLFLFWGFIFFWRLLFFINDSFSIIIVFLNFFNNNNDLWLWWWGLERSEGLLICINVEKGEETIRVVGCRPNVNMTFNAPGCKVFVLQLAKTDDLANCLSVCQFKYIELVLVGQAIDNEVTTTKTTNKQIASLAGNCHAVEGLVGLECVSSSLQVFVPQLET